MNTVSNLSRIRNAPSPSLAWYAVMPFGIKRICFALGHIQLEDPPQFQLEDPPQFQLEEWNGPYIRSMICPNPPAERIKPMPVPMKTRAIMIAFTGALLSVQCMMP